MFIVGLTGGIGSGKSTVSPNFQSLNITVVDADIASRKVVEPGQPALTVIKEHFGDRILTQEGVLDRRKLRKIIASDSNKRNWLESVLHPRIGEQIKKELEKSTSVYTLYVAPLLLETNAYQECSRILVVDVPTEIQIKRTCSRDNVSENDVKKIIATQMNRDKRLKKADDILSNNGTIRELEEEVKKLHEKYLKMALL